MKKVVLLVVILLIIAGAGFYFFANRSEAPTEVTPEQPTGATDSFRPDSSNATFTFDDGAITLSAGRNERPVAPGSAFTEETVILDHTAYGDINGDGRNDAVLFLARYGAGSGSFVYAAAYVSGPVGYRGSNAIFIGDRVAPQSVSVAANGVITVNYLDRSPNDPMAVEPTIRTTKVLVFQNNTLIER